MKPGVHFCYVSFELFFNEPLSVLFSPCAQDPTVVTIDFLAVSADQIHSKKEC
jgi:hypothetical protein